MKRLKEEEFNQEWITFRENFTKAGLDKFVNPDDLLTAMKQSAAGLSEDTGVAYPGGLLVHINLLVPIAQRIAKMISGTFSVSDESVIKVCLLQHLSKIEMFIPNDNQWEIDKRGMNYKFNENLEGCLKFGERSAFNAISTGVPMTPIEYEAMRCMDKDSEETRNGRWTANILTTIVRQANELAYAIEKKRWENENNK